MSSRYRTHTCDELRLKDINKQVNLSGWVHVKRDHGKILFIDLRDHFGIVQLVVYDDQPFFSLLSKITNESIISIKGVVVPREKDNINNEILTGEIEIKVSSCNIESKADALPFAVNNEDKVNDEIGLKYRFLQLRKPSLKQKILLRNEVIKYVRQFLWKRKFHEFHTPILTSTSPEGARDFLVPSRLHPNKYYALPQAPQQFKQLLMMSGFDRYFQIAPCFRDEDPRSDRSPGEFYQIDIEMSFVEQEDVFLLTETLMHDVFSNFSTKKINSTPFIRITYHDAILKYGCDKPDLRNPLIIQDITFLFKELQCPPFFNAIETGAIVRYIKIKNSTDLSRSFFDSATDFCMKNGAKGLAYIKWDDKMIAKGPIVKFLGEQGIKKLQETAKVCSGETIFFICDKQNIVVKILGLFRTFLAKQLNLIEENQFFFCWITDFPFFELDEQNNKIIFSHNPFSMPQEEIPSYLEEENMQKLLNIKAYQYDLVCNGLELSSGAIRNHKLDVLLKAFKIVGYSEEEIDNNFSGLKKGLSFGCPPHGGIAPGLERIIMLLSESENIREVIPFPMDGTAKDVLMNAPSHISTDILKILKIKNLPTI